jgi:hypothetical protein
MEIEWPMAMPEPVSANDFGIIRNSPIGLPTQAMLNEVKALSVKKALANVE